MTLEQYFNSSQLLRDQEEKIKKQRKELLEEAYTEGLFNISLKHLIHEIKKLDPTVHPSAESICVSLVKKVPEHIKTAKDAAKWLAHENDYLQFTLYLNNGASWRTVYVPFTVNDKLRDGTRIIDNAEVSAGINSLRERTITLKKEKNKDLMLNFPPQSDFITKPSLISTAILNCVKAKEAGTNIWYEAKFKDREKK